LEANHLVTDKAHQKRNFFRLDVMLPVKYRKFTGDPVFDGIVSLGRTLNLSSGGMILTVPNNLIVGTKLDMEVELPKNQKLYLVGKVLGGETQVFGGVERRMEKIAFVEVDDDTKDQIMKFILNEQRKIQRKEKRS
jgi:c-di-GMP-binding flagellar brake protein YcgR